MDGNLERLIKETVGHLDEITPDKINVLMNEALKTFSFIKEKGESKDPKDREEALEYISSLKGVIDAEIDMLANKSDGEEATLETLANTKGLLNPEMQEELINAQKQINAFRSQINPNPIKNHVKSKKNKQNWITG